MQQALSNVTWLGRRPVAAATLASNRPSRRLTQREYGGAPAGGFWAAGNRRQRLAHAE